MNNWRSLTWCWFDLFIFVFTFLKCAWSRNEPAFAVSHNGAFFGLVSSSLADHIQTDLVAVFSWKLNGHLWIFKRCSSTKLCWSPGQRFLVPWLRRSCILSSRHVPLKSGSSRRHRLWQSVFQCREKLKHLVIPNYIGGPLWLIHVYMQRWLSLISVSWTFLTRIRKGKNQLGMFASRHHYAIIHNGRYFTAFVNIKTETGCFPAT